MNEPMDHEQISERLLDYLRGEAHERDVAAIESHLESCSGCAAELAVLSRLAEDEPPRMTDLERGRLRRAVGEGIGASRTATVVERGTWRSRIAPALGAAAVIALAAVVAVNLGGGDGAQQGTSLERAADGGGQEKSKVREDRMESRMAPEKDEAKTTTEGSTAGGEDATGGAGPEATASAPGAFFEKKVVRVDEARLLRFGRKNIGRTATVLSNLDADTARGEYLSLLADQAPRSLRPQVRRCDRAARGRKENLVAAFGARGRFENRRSLILGFLYPGTGGDRSRRFSMWAWPIGSCDRPLEVRSGSLKP